LATVFHIDVIRARHEIAPRLAVASISNRLDRLLHIRRALSPLVEVLRSDVIEADEVRLHELLVVSHVRTDGEIGRVLV
ncbi:hypothetical protein PENTCL1PPCAC_13795, partial [Pristionchus entomophagus]